MDSCGVSIICKSDKLRAEALSCADLMGLVLNQISDAPYQLVFSDPGVTLQWTAEPRQGPVRVDFCGGKEAHRRHYGGGKGQLIAKAVGVSSRFKPHVFDATAGLGKDAFVLASLGCSVTLMERSPIAFALLKDGLRRATEFAKNADVELLKILNRMTLKDGDSIPYLSAITEPIADVVYLDPMFPSRQKKSAVKKDMKAFHSVVGQDADNELLFNSAENKAIYRIAVKRPRHAPQISATTPTYSLEGKSSRYDMYAYKGMN